jgi:hypothetical protein
MKKHYLTNLLFLSAILFSCGSNNGSSEDISSYLGLSTYSGLEVYYWRTNGIWYSGLMMGTDRLKLGSEINALHGISLKRMKEVLQTYVGEKDVCAAPIYVPSYPCQDDYVSDHAYYPENHPEVGAYLSSCLSIDSSSRIKKDNGDSTSYKLNLDAKSKTFLSSSLDSSYPALNYVEVSAYILYDVDLELYLNDTLISHSGYTFTGERTWTYYFMMPEKDSTLTFKTNSGTY